MVSIGIEREAGFVPDIEKQSLWSRRLVQKKAALIKPVTTFRDTVAKREVEKVDRIAADRYGIEKQNIPMKREYVVITELNSAPFNFAGYANRQATRRLNRIQRVNRMQKSQ